MVNFFNSSPNKQSKKKSIGSDGSGSNCGSGSEIVSIQNENFQSIGNSGSFDSDTAPPEPPPSTSSPSPSIRSHHLQQQKEENLLKNRLKQQKKLTKAKQNPPEKRVQRATERRRDLILQRKVGVVLSHENELIQQCLGVDSDGYCLRHDDQLVKSGLVRPPHRFESIQNCRSCAFGSESGIKHKNHGQKTHPVAHVVNGALKATKIKKKKKKMKGAFDTRNTTTTTTTSNTLSASNLNGNNSDGSEMDYSTAHDEFASEYALLPPSMSTDFEDAMFLDTTHAARSQTMLQADAMWSEEVALRVMQVAGWDNNKVPLKCHPIYAKYFRMLRRGIPPEEIREIFGEDGPDLLLLNLDPNKAFDDQLDGLSPHVQERLRSSGALTATANADASELTNQVYQAYIKQKELFDKFLQEDQLGITNVVKEKEKGMVDRNGMEPVPGEKKKRKLRIKKKFKRIVKVGGGIGNKFQKDNQTEAEGSDSEEEIEITESNDEDEANIVAIGPGGPMQLQPLPSAGLRRARRPNARRPGAQRGQRRSPPDKGVIQTNEETESPKSSISPSPNGRGGKRPISSQKMDQLMSSPAQPLDLDEGGRVERQTPGAVRQRKAAASAMRNRQSRQKKQTAAAAAAAVARNRQDQSSQRSILKSSSTSSPSNAAAAPPPPAITSQRSILKKQGSNHSIEPTPDSIPSTIQPPVQNLHASHTSVMSRLSGVTQTVVVEPEDANQEQTTVALDVANSKQVLSELRLAKEELDQAQLLLSSAKEREKDLQKANTEKDRKISKLLKTVAGLQQTVKELSVTKVPSPPSSRSPRMEEIATPRGSLRNRHAFALKQQLLGKDNVYCYYCCCYSCHCTVLKVPELPMLSKQGRDSKAPPSLNLEESSPWDEMKSRKRRSSGPPKISAYLGSGKQNGEGVAYEPHNDARPLTKDKKSQMSSLSLEPPGPPTILREEQLPTSSPFDIPNTNSSSPPRSVDLASNVREITPDNRRRIKSPQPGQEKKAAGIVVDITSVKSATESERISDKKRKKRELEEQLRHSQELEALRTASGGMEREMRSDSSEDEEEI